MKWKDKINESREQNKIARPPSLCGNPFDYFVNRADYSLPDKRINDVSDVNGGNVIYNVVQVRLL